MVNGISKLKRITIDIDEQGYVNHHELLVLKTAKIVFQDRYGTLTENWSKEESHFTKLDKEKLQSFIDYVRSEVE